MFTRQLNDLNYGKALSQINLLSLKDMIIKVILLKHKMRDTYTAIFVRDNKDLRLNKFKKSGRVTKPHPLNKEISHGI